MTLTWEEFRKMEIRVGEIVDAKDFPEARNPSYRLTLDFGPVGVKRSSAAIRRWYTKEDLIGRHVLAVMNFVSEVLVLGAVQPDGEVVLLRPDREKALGARVA